MTKRIAFNHGKHLQIYFRVKRRAKKKKKNKSLKDVERITVNFHEEHYEVNLVITKSFFFVLFFFFIL